MIHSTRRHSQRRHSQRRRSLRSNSIQARSAIRQNLRFEQLETRELLATYTGANGSTNNDTWNDAANWSGSVPSGTEDVVIGTGNFAVARSASTPAYTGSLTLNDNATLKVWNNAADVNAYGTGTITMGDGSRIIMRQGGYTFDQPFTLTGDANVTTGESSTGHHTTKTFDEPISGGFEFTISGVNNNTINFNTANTFSSFTTDNDKGGNFRIYGRVANSLGTGDVTINPSSTLIIDAANAMNSSGILNLNGGRDTKLNSSFEKLHLNANQTVEELWIDGVQSFAGTYTASSGDWISGSGSLIVTSGTADVAPTLDSVDIVDDVFGGPIFEDLSPITYTLTFSEDMDASTVTSADFENGGSAPITIGTVTKTLVPSLPTSPSEFTVEVLPSGTGTVQLQVKAGADLKDTTGMSLDTTSAIPDDTTITINAGNTPPATITGTGGSNNSWNTASNWDTNTVPFGPGSAIVGANVTAQVNSDTTPSYTGTLELSDNSTLRINSGNSVGAVQTPSNITLNDQSSLDFRNGSPTFGTIELNGATSILFQGNGAHHKTATFGGAISGSGSLALNGVNNDTFNFDATSTFSGGFSAASNANQGFRINAKADGAFGSGDVAINNHASLEIVANLSDTIADTATLYLNGAKDSRRDAKVSLKSDETVRYLIADDISLAPGTWGSTASAADNQNDTLFDKDDSGILTVLGNSAPTLTSFTQNVDSTAHDTEVEITFAELVAEGDEDDSDGTVDAFIVQAVSTGTLKIGADAGSAQAFAAGSNDTIDGSNNAYWTPDNGAGANGINAFTVVAEDNEAAVSSPAVQVTIDVNGPPVAVDDTNSITEQSGDESNNTVSGNIISGAGSPNTTADSDPNSDTITVDVSDITSFEGTYGTLTISAADGSYTYELGATTGQNSLLNTVDTGTDVTDVFANLTITDGNGESDDSMLTITITGATDNQPPEITQGDGPLTVTMSEDGSPTAFTASLDATDPEGNTLTWSVSSAASQGTADVSGSGASPATFTYTPTANYHGSDSFTVEVSDGNGGTDSIVVNVTIEQVNDPAVFSGDLSGQGINITGTLLAEDPIDGMSSPDYTVISQGSLGTATIDETTGEWTFTATDPSVSGDDSFTVQVTDDDNNLETQVISIEVTPVFVDSEGNLIAQSDDAADRFIFSNAGGGRVHTRLNNTYYGPHAVSGRIIAYGNEGNDRLSISGNLNMDVEFYGGDGKDHLAGGIGNDFLDGGDANDVILTGSGDNTALGGNGNDRLTGRNGSDTLIGQQGNDVLIGSSGSDVLIGDDLDDPLATGSDEISGGSGDDLLIGGPSNDILAGGFGNDVLLGNSGNDLLRGGSGEDLLIGGVGKDVIYGETSADRLVDGTSSNENNQALLIDLLNEWAGPNTGLNRLYTNAGTLASDTDADFLSGGGSIDAILFGGDDGNPLQSGDVTF